MNAIKILEDPFQQSVSLNMYQKSRKNDVLKENSPQRLLAAKRFVTEQNVVQLEEDKTSEHSDRAPTVFRESLQLDGGIKQTRNQTLIQSLNPVLKIAMLKTQADLQITHRPRVQSNYKLKSHRPFTGVNFVSLKTDQASTLDNSSARPLILRQIASKGRRSVENTGLRARN